jgi:pilin isopeptide linkage protein
MTFNNSYHAKGILTLQGRKALIERSIKEGEFTYQLFDASDNLLQEVENDGEGAFAFDALDITEEGTYYYTIVEKNTGQDADDHDTTVYLVTVVATDDGQGNLVLTVTYTIDGEEADEVLFTNKYHEEVVAEEEPEEETELLISPKTLDITLCVIILVVVGIFVTVVLIQYKKLDDKK